MRKRILGLVAITLVVLLAWANVGLAGQRNRLRQRVGNLEQRTSSLEIRIATLEIDNIMASEVRAICPTGSEPTWTVVGSQDGWDTLRFLC